MDLISVIVPVYRVEQYLHRCVDSILNQTYTNLEVILVDDGSPDRCPQMCEEIRTKDSRVKVVHKENGGLGFARNSGLDVVTGEYVTFIDSDDWISKNHIENLFCAAKANNAEIVIGSYTAVSKSGEEQLRQIRLEQKLYSGEDITNDILLPLIGTDTSNPQDVELTSSSCMNLYKVSLIKDNFLRFRSEKVAVAEDLYFNVDCFVHAKRIMVLNETGYYYFENAASISRQYDPKRFDRTICFYHVLKQQIQQYGLEEKVSWRVERTFLMKIRVALRLLVLAKLPRKQTYEEIQRVLGHTLVQKVLHEYPLDTFIPAIRLLTKWMRDEKIRNVYWLIKIREYGKSTSWLKAILKQLGIGK